MRPGISIRECARPLFCLLIGNSKKYISKYQGAAVAYWLERRIRDRNEDFEREFDSPLTHTLSKVRDAQ